METLTKQETEIRLRSAQAQQAWDEYRDAVRRLHRAGTAVKQALYTPPPATQPLTTEQITEICVGLWSGGWRESEMHKFARAIEAAHGIKEQHD